MYKLWKVVKKMEKFVFLLQTLSRICWEEAEDYHPITLRGIRTLNKITINQDWEIKIRTKNQKNLKVGRGILSYKIEAFMNKIPSQYNNIICCLRINLHLYMKIMQTLGLKEQASIDLHPNNLNYRPKILREMRNLIQCAWSHKTQKHQGIFTCIPLSPPTTHKGSSRPQKLSTILITIIWMTKIPTKNWIKKRKREKIF